MGQAVTGLRYHHITCKSAFRKLKHHVGPYEYDMNVYRGCEHACAYCYAYYSQRFMEDQDFTKNIYVKDNIAEELAKQLSSSKWTKQLINIGSVSDSYQPFEKEMRLMRKVLQVLLQYNPPCIISTKSDLILRDLDLIKQLSDVTFVNIACTITTMDEELAAMIEPGAVSAQRRAEVLSIIKQNTNADVGIHCMPMLPYLTDDDASLRKLIKCANSIGVDYAIFQPLHLRGETKRMYFQMLREHFPHLVKVMTRLYASGRLEQSY